MPFKLRGKRMKTSISIILSLALALTAGQVTADDAMHSATPSIKRKADLTGGSAQTQTSALANKSISASPGITGLPLANQRADGVVIIDGTLAGRGEILDEGQHIIRGKVSPGNSPGCVTDHGNVTFEGSAWLEIELGGATACTGYDQYTVNLSLRLNGPTLRVLLISGFVPAAGQRFDVLNWGTLTGSFGTLELPVLPAGLSWDTSQLYTTGELIVADDNAETPLPNWVLVLFGASLLTVIARSKKANKSPM